MKIPNIDKNCFKLDKTLGYMYAIVHGHPLANKSGKVYEHIYVVCQDIERSLLDEECVHHIDRDRANNARNNLKLMSKVDHALLHAKEDGKRLRKSLSCLVCGNIFLGDEHKNKYCSTSCQSKAARKFDINKDELTIMVWSFPTTHIATMLRVSDKAIEKRCNKFGIIKPPRGFWSKLRELRSN
jgi:hypothetical protein